MRNTNTKIWFLVLAAVVLLFGCESPQVTRQNSLAQAVQMVEAQFGDQLTPEQKAHMAWQIYRQMESDRTARQIAAGQIISQGFNNAGNIIANSAPQPNYITPVTIPAYTPVPQTSPQPTPYRFKPIPTDGTIYH
jgi:hypothetical protein